MKAIYTRTSVSFIFGNDPIILLTHIIDHWRVLIPYSTQEVDFLTTYTSQLVRFWKFWHFCTVMTLTNCQKKLLIVRIVSCFILTAVGFWGWTHNIASSFTKFWVLCRTCFYLTQTDCFCLREINISDTDQNVSVYPTIGLVLNTLWYWF